MPLSSEERKVLEEARLVAPMPVAMACGRVLRARTHVERLDAILRAGEVLARYLAAVALSSFAAREEGPKVSLDPLRGNLAFGHFLSLVQQVAALPLNHPAAQHLQAGFRQKSKGKGAETGGTDAALRLILEIRNNLGHQLENISEALAESVLETRKPCRALVEALAGVRGLMGLPLMVVEGQRPVAKLPVARVLVLMGESGDPMPEEVELSEFVTYEGVPFIAAGRALLRLSPLLVWQIVAARASYRLLFLDGVSGEAARYRALEAADQEAGQEVAGEIRELASGRSRPAEVVSARSGRSLDYDWRQRAQATLEARRQADGVVDWEGFHFETLRWYAAKLGGGEEHPITFVRGRLLEGRTSVQPEELRQLVLLFGEPTKVRELLGRDLFDLRVAMTGEGRWDERDILDQHNLLQALRRAIDFLADRLAPGTTIEQLASTKGTPDYIALREALVNQFIHQDYADRSAPAQVELRPESAMFFNTGFSFVESDQLAAGGRSQARNPLIARALRLIGFAELAGSGLPALHRAWREAKRRPPRISSSRETNTFTLTLDWRPLPDLSDENWRKRLGARLTPSQAAALNVTLAPPGGSPAQVASATALDLGEAKQALDHLVRQQLVDCQDGTYLAKPHVRDAAEARAATQRVSRNRRPKA